jgi:hypothetical protein
MKEDLDLSKEWWERNKDKRRVTFFKLLEVWSVLDTEPSGCRLRSEVRGYPYTPGEHRSRSKVKPLPKRNRRELNLGIHGFIRRKDVADICGNCPSMFLAHRVVPFHASPKDFIAVGEGNGSTGHILFRKATLTKRAYDRALREV